MQIYIGNLSHEVSSHDLIRLFRGFEDHTSIEFKYYMRGKKRFYFALTSIVPERMALKAIKRCRMKRVKGRMIALREYKDRALMNERRSSDSREKSWECDERRTAERRNLQHDKGVNDNTEYHGPAPVHSYLW